MSAVHAVVIGELGVGKTSLVCALGGEVIRKDATAVFYQIAQATARPICVVECTALMHCPELIPEVFVLAFDLSRPDTFAAAIAKWATFEDLPDSAQSLLVGCKADLATDVMLSADAKAYAATEFDGYFETSATAGTGDIEALRNILLHRTASSSPSPPPATSPVKAVGASSDGTRSQFAFDKHTRDIWLFDKNAFAQQSANIHASSASKGRVYSTALAKSKRHDSAAIERGHAISSRLAVPGRKTPAQSVAVMSPTTPKKSIHLTSVDGSPRTYSFMQATQASIHRAEALARKNDSEVATESPDLGGAPRRRRSSMKQPPPIVTVLDGLATRKTTDSICDVQDTVETRSAEALTEAQCGPAVHEDIAEAAVLEVDVDVRQANLTGAPDLLASPVELDLNEPDPPHPAANEAEFIDSAHEPFEESYTTAPPEPLPAQLASLDTTHDTPRDLGDSATDDDDNEGDITFDDDDDVLGALDSFQLSI